jgi:precorrin-2 dehydrogenase/sirohydrochlorin ferrochelatase
MMTALFPAFLKLKGRKCLVVGGGVIAEQKLGGLLEAEAAVILVAPQILHSIQAHVRSGVVRWQPREFEEADIEGAALVIAATGNPEVNERIFRACDDRSILCNAVDEPERCHFYYPAVVRRGDLQIAISTNGKSPALAQRLRIEFESLFDNTYADWLRWLGEVRDLYFRTRVGREQRVRTLHQLASRPVFERYRKARTQTNEVRHG